MVEENISQEFRLQNEYKTRYYFLEEIQQNKLMSRKHKKVSQKSTKLWTLNCI